MSDPMEPRNVRAERAGQEPETAAADETRSRRPYRSPRLEVLGEVASITMGSPGTFQESGQEPVPSKA